jgi:hypothetical protein
MQVTNEILAEAAEVVEKNDTVVAISRFKTKTDEKNLIYQDKKEEGIDADNPFYQAFSRNKEKINAIVSDEPVVIPKAKERKAKVTVTNTRPRRTPEGRVIKPGVVENVSVTVQAKKPETREIHTGETKKITCVDCSKEFELTAKNIAWFEQQGFDLPKRCPDCRKKRKEARATQTN